MRNKLLFLIAPAVLLVLLFAISFLLPPHDDASASELHAFSMVADKEIGDEFPVAPISTKYAVEHRTALDGREVRLEGVIVEPSLSQGKIFLADSNKSTRNPAYDLMVMVGSGASRRDYLPGQRLIIRGIIRGGADSVLLELQSVEPKKIN